MKRTVMIFFALTLVLTPTYAQVPSQPPAQSNCMLTVRGIRLGMSLQQLLALFPASSKRKETRDAIEKAKTAANNETVYVVFDSASEGSEQFNGVDSVSVGIYKGQVVDFTVLYVGPTWRTIDEWVNKLAETFKLPNAKGWTVGPSENPNRMLKCKTVIVEAEIQGGGGSIRVRDTEHDKEMEKQKEAGEEKKRRDFKP
jgi:hypothetical protein